MSFVFMYQRNRKDDGYSLYFLIQSIVGTKGHPYTGRRRVDPTLMYGVTRVTLKHTVKS